MTIFEQIKEEKIKYSTHCSDLYVPVCDETKEILEDYEFKNQVTTFVSQIDGQLWFDIPFAYDDFYKKADMVSKTIRETLKTKKGELPLKPDYGISIKEIKMSDCEVNLSNGPLEVITNFEGKSETINNFHIDKVDVYTGGPDDYLETEAISVKVKRKCLVAERCEPLYEKVSKYRLRYEPAARVYLKSEHGPRVVLTISHHKGEVYIDAEQEERSLTESF